MTRSCPSREQLLRMISEPRGEEPGDLLVEAHVAECRLCQSVLDQLTSEDSDSIRDRVSPTLHPERASGGSLAYLAGLEQTPPTELLHGEANGKKETEEIGGGPPELEERAERSSWPSIPGYEIERELGRGGMGIIYLARQLRPDRHVAIKMINARDRDRSDSLLRLSIEGDALARLRHPNIVQIYEVGAVDGYPFLSMEYVEGGNLDQAMTRHQLTPRQAATLAQSLALAVHAAHQSGIIHRDLKPANVLLAPPPGLPAGSTSFAVSQAIPKISDFGLAKRLGSESDLTRTGQVLGTPRCMAPEQVTSGATVGIPADVYALGALLYEMLAGCPPFRGESPWEILMQVVHQPAAPPSEHRRGIPRDLDLITLRCLDKTPENRYASASALAEDLGRHLAGEPVTARPTGTMRRLWLWCRRKPGIAGLAAALVLVALAGMAGVVSQWRRAERNLQEARTQEQRAVGNFRLARSAVDETLTRVSENRLFLEPGMQALRKELLSDALRYFQEFVRFQGDDPVAQRDLMTAYKRLGDITREIGSIEDAKSYYQKGLESTELLTQRRPADTELTSGRAETLLALSTAQFVSRQAEAATRSAELALDLFRALDRDGTNNLEIPIGLARSLTTLGSQEMRAGKLVDAEARFREAITVLEKLSDPKARRALATAFRSLGETLGRTPGRLNDAMASFRASTEIWKSLVHDEPANFWVRADLASSYLQRADFLIFENLAKEAMETLRPARELLEPLVRDNPRVSSLRYALGLVDYVTGSALLGLGSQDEALRSYRRALEELGQVARENPTEEHYQSPGLAGIYLSMGELYRSLGDLAAAGDSMRASLKIQAEATQRNPGSLGNQVNLAMVHRSLGMIEAESGDAAAAIVSARRALAILEKIPRGSAPNVMVQSEMFQTRLVMGIAERKAGRPAVALDWFQRAESDLAALSALDPANVEYRMQLGLCRCRLSALERSLGHPSEAMHAWERARPVIESLPLDVSDRLFSMAILRSTRIPLFTGRDPETESERHHQQELAVDALKRAVALGFKNIVWLTTDPDLEPIRQRQDFLVLVGSIKRPSTATVPKPR